jgi:hypothetical protein
MREPDSKQPLNTALKPPSEISDTVTVKSPRLPNKPRAPGSGAEDFVRGEGTVSKTLTADPRDEYVSAGGYVWLPRFIRALPFYIDDLSRDFGDDIYDRMLLDSQVQACVNVRKAAVLADGVQLSPVKDIQVPAPQAKRANTPQSPDPVTFRGRLRRLISVLPQTLRTLFSARKDAATEPAPSNMVDAASALSQEITEFCRWNLEHLQGRPFLGRSGVMWELLDGIALGHKLAEQVYEIPEAGRYAGMLTLKALKVKPRKSTSFVVDVYFNVIGVIGLIPGQGAPVIVESIIGEPGQIPNMLPRDKFAVYSHQQQNGDPRGTSDLRGVYEPWYFKRQNWAEYLRYLKIFGGGFVWGTTPDGATDQAIVDENGNPTGIVSTAEQAQLANLQELSNGGVSSMPFGSEVHVEFHPGQNSPYDRAIEVADRQIAKGLLGQTLATEEGAHMARAASDNHADILTMFTAMDKEECAAFIRHEILRLLVLYNYGEDAARDLVPNVLLGETQSRSFAQDATAVAALQQSGYLHWTQYQGIDERLGLPVRDMDVVIEEQAEHQALSSAAATMPRGNEQ